MCIVLEFVLTLGLQFLFGFQDIDAQAVEYFTKQKALSSDRLDMTSNALIVPQTENPCHVELAFKGLLLLISTRFFTYHQKKKKNQYKVFSFAFWKHFIPRLCLYGQYFHF